MARPTHHIVRRLYTPSAVAKVLGVSTKAVHRLIGGRKGTRASGPLDAEQVGRRLYVSQAQLDSYLRRAAQ